jgi:hypothetical protein
MAEPGLTVDNLRNALEHIRVAAALHHWGGAFDPEHMLGIANLATRALIGEAIEPLPDPEEIRANAAGWSNWMEAHSD